MNKLQILKLLEKYEKEANCPKRSVAAILVRKGLGHDWVLEDRHDLLRYGTNTRLLLSNDFRCSQCVEGYKGMTCTAIHAEADCLIGLPFEDTKDGTLIVSWSPCPECCKLIKRAGIKRVIVKEPRLKLISKLDASFYEAKTYDDLAEKLLGVPYTTFSGGTFGIEYIRLWEQAKDWEVA